MVIEKWLKSLRSKSTRDVYLSGLKRFAKVVSDEPDLNRFAKEYVEKVKEGFNPFDDLLKYASFLTETNTPPKTAGVYVVGMRNFLEFTLDYELTKKQRRLLRNKLPRGKRARTVEDEINREKIQEVIRLCPLKGQALFLVLASSGIRVGEALQLELDDIDLNSVPVKLNVRGEYTKTGEKYYSFISGEARGVLDVWLKTREQYLKSSAKRGIGLPYRHGEKSTEDNRIFPFTFAVASAMWNRALKKTGLENHDKSTNRRTLHIHMLRKFFNSQLKDVDVPTSIVDALMGHERGLSITYDRFTKKQIKDWYIKGEPYLTISMPEGVREIKKQTGKTQEDLIKLWREVQSLERELKAHRAFLKTLWEVQEAENKKRLSADWEEIRQSDIDEQKWRDEMMKEETFTEEDRKQIKRAKKQLKKIRQKKREIP